MMPPAPAIPPLPHRVPIRARVGSLIFESFLLIVPMAGLLLLHSLGIGGELPRPLFEIVTVLFVGLALLAAHDVYARRRWWLEVRADAVQLRWGLYRRTFPYARLQECKAVELGADYHLGLRTFGVELPGYHVGRFKLREAGRKGRATAFVTGRVGPALLLRTVKRRTFASVEGPEACAGLIATLAERAEPQPAEPAWMLATEGADGALSERGRKRLVARTPQRLVFHGIKGALVLTVGGFFRTEQELLWVFWTDERWYNVIVFLTPGGDLDAWRCHVTLPPVIADGRLTMTDLGMDVSARAAGAARTFDVENLARLRAAGTIDDAMAARAEATAALLVEDLEGGTPPITEREAAILLHRAREGKSPSGRSSMREAGSALRRPAVRPNG